MFHLPDKTELKKQLPKKAVFEKFDLKAAERDRFNADVARMDIVAHISPATVPALAEGERIKGIYVLLISLKQRDYSEKNILLLQRLIPQNMVFALQYNPAPLGEDGRGLTRLAVFHTVLQQSEWMPTKQVTIPLVGTTLDAVWENIIATIGNITRTEDSSLEEQIQEKLEREKILKQLAVLEKQCKAEKQPRRKYELHQRIIMLKRKLYEQN